MLRLQSYGPVTRLQFSRSLLGRPVHWVSAYYVDGLLVDSGLYYTRNELVAQARALSVGQVFCTHQHEDHTGGVGALYRRLGLVPQAGADTVPHLIRPPAIHLYRLLVWGRAEATQAQAVTHVETDRYHFEVIPTPGHSPDHTVLYEPRLGWVFSGDLFIHEQAKYIRADEDLAQLVASLQRVANLDPQRLFCGHLGMVETPRDAIERKLRYWEGLRGKMQDLRHQGRPLADISQSILGPEGAMTRFSRGHLSKLNLTRALVNLERPLCS